MSGFAAPIAEQIWDMKYRLRVSVDGPPIDADVAATWSRVARALAETEAPEAREAWQARFFEVLADFQFLPAGRVLAGAGANRQVTLFNCFVMGTIPDTMSGIFEMLREAALTMQQGGGIGYDFSTIRPKGAPVAGVGADASGPVSFMDVWDSMCRTIMSAGSRRGAMMATMRCDHPDIEDFIAAKADSARLRMFNLSVLASDAFMHAVQADADWNLMFEGRVFKTMKARALWTKIMRATYDYAEPGVIFIDRINARNNLWYAETIACTNPCGEQPLPPYGACLLGSVNLAALVDRPFEPGAEIDAPRLDRIVSVAVRMMDNVIDVSGFPLEAQAAEARAKRRIGLGVTGLADALAMTGRVYGSDAAVEASRRWLGRIRDAAYSASCDIAAEKGAFPLYDAQKFLSGETVRALPQPVRDKIASYGVRNALLTSIAPTGTISLYAGNVSSGIEPIFATSYRRKVLQPDGGAVTEEVEDYAVALYRRKFGPDAALPSTFVTAQTLSPKAHLAMQAAAQDYIDSAISKTINLPEDISFADFEAVYLDAYRMGCKGCTTYRPNPVTGAVLSTDQTAETAEKAPIDLANPLDRPDSLPGATYKLRWPRSPHAMYITLNDVEIDGRQRPFEIFINSKNMEHYAWTVALTRMVSAVFRRGGDVRFVVEELKAVFDPQGGAWMDGAYVPSILAAIGGVVERHMKEIGFWEGGAPLSNGVDHEAIEVSAPRPTRLCSACGSSNVRVMEGCATCADCGYSSCS